MNKKYITKSFKETQKLGQNFAREILASGTKKTAVILALRGDLGAGKTTFLQGFAKGLGIEEKILSPTFIVMKRFNLPAQAGIYDLRFKNFYHFDLYRLEKEKDLEFLNFKEIIENPENIVAIEWPIKISKILPKNVLAVKFNHLKENKRGLTIFYL